MPGLITTDESQKWDRRSLLSTTTATTTTSAIVALYKSSAGVKWLTSKHWLDESFSVCSWYHVSCSSGEVLRLGLQGNNLVGSVQTEVGWLSSLTAVQLYANSMYGQLPSELGSLVGLTAELGLHAMSLSGRIPSEIGNILNLHRNLQLYCNHLTGTIPTEIGMVTGVTYALLLDSNSLSGTLPTEIGRLTAMTESLSLHSNKFKGRIPSQFGSLTTLARNLWLDSNSLSGTLPTELGGMSQFVSSLEIDGNAKICGTIPTELAALTDKIAQFEFENTAIGNACQPTFYPTISASPTFKPTKVRASIDDTSMDSAISLDPLLVASYTMAFVFVCLIFSMVLFRAYKRSRARIPQQEVGYGNDLVPILGVRHSDGDVDGEEDILEFKRIGMAIIDGIDGGITDEEGSNFAPIHVHTMREEDERSAECLSAPGWSLTSRGGKNLPPLRRATTSDRPHVSSITRSHSRSETRGKGYPKGKEHGKERGE